MEREFLSSYGTRYGYRGRITDIRDEEFPKLRDMVYLDHTGSTLYSKSQLQKYHEHLLEDTYGNPHSSCPSSEKSCQMIDDVRQDILSFFNTSSEKYHVIFTSNTTNAIKMVAENFNFRNKANHNSAHNGGNPSATCNNWFVYLQDNHTSVVGIRAVALSKGVWVRPVTHVECSDKHFNIPVDSDHALYYTADSHNNYFPTTYQYSLSSKNNQDCEDFEEPNNLFAFPAMSNFSGHKYPLEWIDSVQQMGPFSRKVLGKWFVLLDAASFISTSLLDLSSYQPDFVPISFYKLFGFPTGLGALLVNARGINALQKSYFGGGTVSAYSSDTLFHVFKASFEDRHEDGTLPFLEILSLKYGFEMLTKLTMTMDHITEHTFCLAQFLYHELKKLRHYNGKDVCQLYCDTHFETSAVQGPIVNFNLLRSNGEYVGYTEVSKLAAIYNIHLRTGCFCNIGACQRFLGLSSEQLKNNLKAGHVCGDGIDMINGRPTGSVRISFGYMSAFSDVEKFINFIRECFVEKLCDLRCGLEMTVFPNDKQVLKKMFIYPIKSCAAIEVQQWDISDRGFCYDREWMIVNQSGSCLSQKRESRLCLIKPSIDLKRNILQIQAPGMTPFELSLIIPPTDGMALVTESKICGTRVSGIDSGDEVSAWLTSFLKRKCRLLRKNPNVIRTSTLMEGLKDRGNEHAISLTNDSQLLIITEASCLDLLRHIKASSSEQISELTVEKLVKRFRPNLVIPGVIPYEEEAWNSVTIGKQIFKCCGVCYRCQMISINPNNGERSKEPLRTLSKIRGSKIPFGVHLHHVSSKTKVSLAVGDLVRQNNST